MPPSKQDDFKRLRVTCPTCHERMEVELEDRPQSIACTYCEARVSVPSLELARQQFQLERPRSAPQVEGYSVEAPAASRQPGEKKASARKAPRKATEAKIIVTCPTCHERMHVVPQEKSGRVACTDCGTTIHVPARDVLGSWEAIPIRPKDEKVLGAYSAGPVSEVAPIRTSVFDRMAEIRKEKPVTPPKWVFFSRVFLFPWSAGAVFRWGWMALGFTLLALMAGGLYLTSGAVAAQGGPTGGVGAVGLGFLMLPLIWITVFTFAFSADCFLRVLESTAYGLDQVDAWPEGGWKEWVPNLLYLGWIAALPTVLAYGSARLATWQDLPFWPVMLGVLFVTYPIALMSALEANSVWVPLTAPVVKSLFVAAGGWIVFYLLTGVLCAGLWALAVFGLPFAGFGALVVLGLTIPAALLIYARLMGRLAWKINRRISS